MDSYRNLIEKELKLDDALDRIPLYNADRNHCILNDLVISFPLTSKQIREYNEVSSRYNNCKQLFIDYQKECTQQDFSKQPIPPHLINANKSHIPRELDDKIKSILSPFEYQQYIVSKFNFFGLKEPKSKKDKLSPVSLNTLAESISQFSLVSQNFPIQFLKVSKSKSQNRIPHINSIKLYDRIGNTFKFFKSNIHNDLLFKMYFNSTCIFNKEPIVDDNQVEYNVNLIRKSKKTNEIILSKIIIPKPNFSDKYSIIYFEGKENFETHKRVEYSTIDFAEAVNLFKTIFKLKTSIDFPIETKDSKSKDLETSYLNLDFKKCQVVKKFPEFNNIPKLKDIAFSMIRELILLDKQWFDKYLTRLPKELIEDLIGSCQLDKTPNGFNSMIYLVEKCRMINNRNEFTENNIVLPTVEKVIKLANEHDHWFAYSLEKGISQNIYHPYNTDFLIDVFENHDRFILKQWEDESQYILKSNEYIDYGKPSIVSMDQFHLNFSKETSMRLNSDFDWSNTVIMGGLVLLCLLENGDNNSHLLESFKSTSVNFYFYGLTQNEIIQKINGFISNVLKDDFKNYSMTKSLKGTLTLSKHHPYRHLTFHLEAYQSKSHILVTNDMNSNAFLYDGDRVFCLYRSMESVNYRVNFASKFSWMLNGDVNYQNRLVTYYERGFSVISFDLGFFKDIQEFDPHHNHSGLALLYSCHKNSAVLDFLKSSVLTIPYGEDIDKNEFQTLIHDHTYFSRYQEVSMDYLNLDHHHQYPNNRKFSSLSANLFPYLTIQPPFDVLFDI
ncbi:hypothetical protein DLAC_03432 [Tieghemostelium lacteum]|uniref:Uncharacterized protein n=1 Tax=Tieghemostelium lacteum TaxID=361077 RepID=A0A152A236_TIELA|nr:hypothetical protein DLAC_03432 [Tieghemostelium lacteum]|eukprot:KYR00269.1 hypothetical protein DLAC_03432 [Tieghemostelium lacteum]